MRRREQREHIFKLLFISEFNIQQMYPLLSDHNLPNHLT